MWLAGLLALLSHWRRQPLQLVMLLLGLSVATALWTGVQAINAEARASYREASFAVASGAVAQLVPRSGKSIPVTTYVALRRAGWLVSPILDGEVMFGDVRINIVGVDPLTSPREALAVEQGTDDTLERFLSHEGLMFISAATKDRLAGAATLPLAVDDGLSDGVGIVDIGQAQTLLGAADTVSRLIIAPEQPDGRPPLDVVAPDLVFLARSDATDLARLTDSFHLNLTAFGLLAFVVGLFIVYSTIGLAFEQRRPVFRTLRALGIPARVLTGLLLLELVGLALVAGLAGVAMGYGVAVLLLPDVSATLRGLYGADVPGTLELRASWWLAGLGIAVLGTLVSAAESLWRVSRLPMLAPAQPRAWACASETTLAAQALLALLLFVGGLAALVLGSGVVAGFTVLASLLLGAALLLPALLAGVVGLGQRLVRGPLAQWFWADTRQQIPGLSLSLMALLLALSANIGVGTMVGSFRLTFVAFLDQRLAAELYVEARSPEEYASLQAWLEPRVEALLPIAVLETELAGQAGQLLGVSDHATYRANWPLLQYAPGAWDRLAQGEAILINEQLSRRENLGVGDRLDLRGQWTVPIAGVYADYGNPAAQAMVGLATLQARYPEASQTRFGVRTEQAGVEALKTELRNRFDLPDGVIVDQASLKRMGLEVFERTFAVTAALNVLTLGVAGLALFASLMTLSGIRLPQLAPVWAMGITRRRLAMLELVRTLALAALTLAAAVPVGLALAWVLLEVVNVEAFGWKLPMHLFPLDWIQLGGLALAAALLAAAIPVRRLSRLAPSDLLRVFANER
jgi:putative ABC transport system permease protein